EAVPRWQRLVLPVLDVRERVVASVDGGVAINADQLFAEGDLEAWQGFERSGEIITPAGSVPSHPWGEGSAEDSIRGVEKNNLVRVILCQGLGPFRCRGGDVFLRPG